MEKIEKTPTMSETTAEEEKRVTEPVAQQKRSE